MVAILFRSQCVDSLSWEPCIIAGYLWIAFVEDQIVMNELPL